MCAFGSVKKSRKLKRKIERKNLPRHQSSHVSNGAPGTGISSIHDEHDGEAARLELNPLDPLP